MNPIFYWKKEKEKVTHDIGHIYLFIYLFFYILVCEYDVCVCVREREREIFGNKNPMRERYLLIKIQLI
jgi:hypothetical protein